jgi:hypothetical protein
MGNHIHGAARLPNPLKLLLANHKLIELHIGLVTVPAKDTSDFSLSFAAEWSELFLKQLKPQLC